MTIERMIELLEIEHECMLRGAHDDCDRKCADCELVQDDEELHEMYTNVIALLKEQGKPDCEHANHNGIGCLGYAGCTQDDEPIEFCKRCEKYTGNVYEAVKRE